MEIAVVKVAGKQYLVSPNETLKIQGKLADGQKTLVLDEILLFNSGDKLSIGTPSISGLSLQSEVVSIVKGQKVRVAKFKAKSRYRRVIGFRPFVTTLKLNDFSLSPTEKKTEPKNPKSKK